ncbi:uncharacterized protein LOC106662319 isoform X2 [Cimex lectularius]|uniref:Uncharacterized protein n=1 Tax=Cimex lectularius TaxID=79782 RepID=A0A8I6RB06_CIMLE|nr:uncharacterized protein LOC106662319 isoform X2 [Cimex lectularius]
MGTEKLLILLGLIASVVFSALGYDMRKSIVYDKKTPGVFYCPQHKVTDVDKLIVRARPLKKLCEFDGKKPLPSSYKSDCYADIDESDFGCKEKYRIMKRLKDPKDEVKKKKL